MGLWRKFIRGRGKLVVIIVVQIAFPREISGTLVLVRLAILFRRSVSKLNKATQNWSFKTTYILMSTQGLLDISRRKLIKFLIMPKNDNRHIDGAENG